MLQNRATCEASHRRFVERVIAFEKVWYLKNADGVACSSSNAEDDEVGGGEDEEEITVMMFWSDRAYAARVKNNGFEDYVECSMDLFDFLFRWLPGMTGDGVLAGTNWDGELRGVECDPYELRMEIEERMPEGLKQAYEARCGQAGE